MKLAECIVELRAETNRFRFPLRSSLGIGCIGSGRRISRPGENPPSFGRCDSISLRAVWSNAVLKAASRRSISVIVSSEQGEARSEADVDRVVAISVKILDSRVQDLVAAVLRFEGFTVFVNQPVRTETGPTFREHEGAIDLVVAELEGADDGSLRVPGKDLHGHGSAVALFLKPRERMHDRVHGLTIGAGSFLEMPFSVSEFVARVRSVLRHAGLLSTPQVVSYADLVLDEEEVCVRRGTRGVELTRTEFGLLRYLIANAPRVLSKVEILEHVWPYDFKGDTSVVETYVSYLRRKVDVGGPPLIHTVRGIGYTLRMPY